MRHTRLALGGTFIFPSSPTGLRICEGLLALVLASVYTLLGCQSEGAP